MLIQADGPGTFLQYTQIVRGRGLFNFNTYFLIQHKINLLTTPTLVIANLTQPGQLNSYGILKLLSAAYLT